MGTTAHVVVVGGPPRLVGAAVEAIADLERRWSRFIPDSELNRLNRCAGQGMPLSEPTFDLLVRAVDAWHATAGRFDPTVLAALETAGYDRTFDAVDPSFRPARGAPSPGCGAITLDPERRIATLPRGVAIDAGGIGKGLAADRVAEWLMASGADGVCVNVGGDLRCIGDAPQSLRHPCAWRVGIEDPFDSSRLLGTVALAGGAVASTTRLRRSWGPVDHRAHHLIDPATGQPAATGLASVTVLTGEAWWAEVIAKAAFVAGRDQALVVGQGLGAEVMTVDDGGRSSSTPGFAGMWE